jgi:hypothetical protein
MMQLPGGRSNLSDDYEKFYDDFQTALNEDLSKTHLSIMILGPNTEQTTPAAQLRKFIIEKCKSQAVTIKGEHKKLIGTYTKTLGAGSHLCGYELYLAKTKVDAVIIIPASAGSLVELGMFALVKEVCQRTLVLFSDVYSDETIPTFIHLGPKLAYKLQGATVEFVNYPQKDLIWETVAKFVEISKANKFHGRLLRTP